MGSSHWRAATFRLHNIADILRNDIIKLIKAVLHLLAASSSCAPFTLWGKAFRVRALTGRRYRLRYTNAFLCRLKRSICIIPLFASGRIAERIAVRFLGLLHFGKCWDCDICKLTHGLGKSADIVSLPLCRSANARNHAC